MAIVDDRTANLDLPLPHIDNKLADDLPRLRQAIGGIDTAMAMKADLDAGGKVLASQVPRVESTDDVDEGTANLYFTEARARDAQQPATAAAVGVVKVGSGLSVAADGLLSVVGAAGAGGVPAFNEVVIAPTAAGQKNFTVPGGYTAGMIEVFIDGVLLYGNGEDYTATNGTQIVLVTGVAGTSNLMLVRRWTTSNNFPFSALTDKPTTVAGFGITELPWADVTGSPTTLAGYGITDAVGPKPNALTISTDLNTLPDVNAVYDVQAPVNAPFGITGSWAYVTVIAHRNAGYVAQTCRSLDLQGPTYERRKINGAWGLWRPLGMMPVRHIYDTGGDMYGVASAGLNTINMFMYAGGPCNKLMPAGGSPGDRCVVVVANGRSDNCIFVNPADGQFIMGLNETLTIDNPAAALHFVLTLTGGWRIM